MPTIRTSLTTLALLGTAAALTACGSMSSPAAPAFNQSSLPTAVQVPAGQRIAMETVGSGAAPLPLREREGPAAKRWEGEGVGASCYAAPLSTFRYPASWQPPLSSPSRGEGDGSALCYLYRGT